MNKFKKGEVVICLEDCEGSFTKGKLYIVRESMDHCGNLGIVKDDRGSGFNGWCHSNFKKLSKAGQILFKESKL